MGRYDVRVSAELPLIQSSSGVTRAVSIFEVRYDGLEPIPHPRLSYSKERCNRDRVGVEGYVELPRFC